MQYRSLSIKVPSISRIIPSGGHGGGHGSGHDGGHGGGHGGEPAFATTGGLKLASEPMNKLISLRTFCSRGAALGKSKAVTILVMFPEPPGGQAQRLVQNYDGAMIIHRTGPRARAASATKGVRASDSPTGAPSHRLESPVSRLAPLRAHQQLETHNQNYTPRTYRMKPCAPRQASRPESSRVSSVPQDSASTSHSCAVRVVLHARALQTAPRRSSSSFQMQRVPSAPCPLLPLRPRVRRVSHLRPSGRLRFSSHWFAIG